MLAYAKCLQFRRIIGRVRKGSLRVQFLWIPAASTSAPEQSAVRTWARANLDGSPNAEARRLFLPWVERRKHLEDVLKKRVHRISEHDRTKVASLLDPLLGSEGLHVDALEVLISDGELPSVREVAAELGDLSADLAAVDQSVLPTPCVRSDRAIARSMPMACRMADSRGSRSRCWSCCRAMFARAAS